MERGVVFKIKENNPVQATEGCFLNAFIIIAIIVICLIGLIIRIIHGN